ncbi:MAG: alpha/beta fold hydrolase [Myxococcales bacterium]|nr:alpha/beta fold hydrolase [Myxococcales bacterium]
MLGPRSAAHWWTIAPNLLGRLRPPPVADRPWSTIIDDAQRPATIAGALALPARSDPAHPADLYLLVHGLGGTADSPYMLAAAAAVQARGHGSLRISLRGAGDSSPDFYHAGIGRDLSAVLADPSLRDFGRVFIIGFSMGGHIALHNAWWADRDPRIAAVIAVCSPLDLAANIAAIDTPRVWLYRRHVLSGLETMYASIHGRRRRFESVREWDQVVVVPRWGFDDVDHYWRTQSSGPRLVDTEVPVLFVGAEEDPMVPAHTLRPHLQHARGRRGDLVHAAWVRWGGHVGFPASVDLGMAGPPGLMNQILSWCEKV